MANLHLKPDVIEASKTFAKGSALAVVGVMSIIIAATLIFAWFFI